MALKDLFFSIFAQDKTGTAFDAVDSKLDRLQRRAASAGAKMTAFGAVAGVGTLPITIGLRDAIGSASEWEAALNRTQAALQATEGDMAALADLTRNLDGVFWAGDAALAAENLAKNGLSAAQILDGALAGALDAAAAGGADLSSAADLMTDAMAGFGIEAAEAGRVVDGMAGTMVASKLDFDNYRLALGQAGGVAGGLGVTFEDFNAALASTASLFASGSDAGTSFKTFLTRLAPQSNDAAEAMAALGLEFYDAQGQMKPIADIADTLQMSLAGLSDEAKTTALTDIFGTDAMRTAIGLAEQGRAGIEAMQRQIADTSAADLAAARMEGAAGAMMQWDAAVKNFGVSLGASGLLEAFTGIVQSATGFLDWLGEADPLFLRAGAAAAVFAAAIAPISLIAGGLALAIGTLGAPVVAAIAGFTALAAAVAAFWPEIKLAGEWVGGALVGALDAGVAAAAALDQAFIDAFTAIQETVIAVVTVISDWIGNKLTAVMESVGAKVEWVEGKFAWLYDKVVGNSWVPDLVEEIGTSFGKLDGNMVKVTDDATASVNDSFSGLYSDVTGALKTLAMDGELSWSNMWESLAQIGARKADQIVGQVFDTLGQGVGNALSSVFGGGGGGGLGGLLGGGGGGGLFAGIGAAFKGLLGFDSGGSFTVRGKAGMDRNVAAVRLSEGEEVNVTRRGQGAAPSVTVHIHAQDVDSFKASRAQVGRQISAAVSAGMRAA